MKRKNLSGISLFDEKLDNWGGTLSKGFSYLGVSRQYMEEKKQFPSHGMYYEEQAYRVKKEGLEMIREEVYEIQRELAKESDNEDGSK